MPTFGHPCRYTCATTTSFEPRRTFAAGTSVGNQCGTSSVDEAGLGAVALGLPDESAGERDGLTEPIEVNVNPHRAGLGMSIQKLALSVSSLSSPLDWREDAKQRRWNGVRGRE